MLLREQRKRLTWRMVCAQAFHIPAHVYFCEGLVLVSQEVPAPVHVPGPAGSLSVVYSRETSSMSDLGGEACMLNK